MKIFRKLLLAVLLLAALRVPCFAQEAFHGAYLQGFPDGSIRPEKQVTRAELAEILHRMMSPDARQELTSESAFRDVGCGHWAYGSGQRDGGAAADAGRRQRKFPAG